MTKDVDVHHLDAFQACEEHYEGGRKFFQTSMCSKLCKVTDLSLHFSYTSVTWKYRHLTLQSHVFCHLCGLETGSSLLPHSFLQNSLEIPQFQGGRRYLFPVCTCSFVIIKDIKGKLMVSNTFKKQLKVIPVQTLFLPDASYLLIRQMLLLVSQ